MAEVIGARLFDPYNPFPPSQTRSFHCPSCGTVQPVFDDSLFGPRCARCASPMPIVFATEPPTAAAEKS